MTASIKTLVVATALNALTAGSASASSVIENEVRLAVQLASGPNSNVFVKVDNNTATITGYFKDVLDRQRAIREAKSTSGIDRVIDRSLVSN